MIFQAEFVRVCVYATQSHIMDGTRTANRQADVLAVSVCTKGFISVMLRSVPDTIMHQLTRIPVSA